MMVILEGRGKRSGQLESKGTEGREDGELGWTESSSDLSSVVPKLTFERSRDGSLQVWVEISKMISLVVVVSQNRSGSKLKGSKRKGSAREGS